VLISNVAAAAALAIMLSADWRDKVIAPGPLTEPHAQLLRRDGERPRCSACHSSAGDGVSGWTATLVVGQGDRPTQSQLCMKCHDKTIVPQLALAAHNLPPDELRRIRQGDKSQTGRGGETGRQGEVSPSSVSLDANPPVSLSLVCAACHREHHGAMFDLTAVDNQACQTCHRQKYESFATDHPDFGAWPYEQRTPIAFDHASHQAKHFREKKQAFDCRQCHVDDPTRSVQLLTVYETACASCHNDKIATSVARGIPVFALPTLDVAALRKAGLDIGPWPAAANGDFDGKLPPIMKLLLSADPAAAKAMATLGHDFELLDIDAESREQLTACADLALALKRLLSELNEAGAAAVRPRLSAALGRDLTEDEFKQLVTGLSIDTVQSATRAWLGQAVAGGPPERAAERGRREPTDSAPGAWFYDPASLSIRYLPAGHADPVLAAWMTSLAIFADAEKNSLQLAVFNELTLPTAPGLCASCHTIEKRPAGQRIIHWRATDRSKAPRAFTKFSHGPHILLPELADCTACHSVDEAGGNRTNAANEQPAAFVSEFQPLTKQLCATCHTLRAAGDRCQSCHNYHVESVESLRLSVEGQKRLSHLFDSQPSTFNPQPAKTSSGTRPARR
jgi:hypothetical protein